MRILAMLAGLLFILGMTPDQRIVEVQHAECGGGGMGVIVADGTILTAYHVTDTCALEINGHPAERIAGDEEQDWAILRCEEIQGEAAVWAPIVPGGGYYYMMNGSCFDVRFTTKDNDGDWIFVDHQPEFGDSGSGIFNADGELVALLVARYNDRKAGLACSAEFAHDWLFGPPPPPCPPDSPTG